MYEQQALVELKQAIEDAVFYADGEKLDIKGGDAKARSTPLLNTLFLIYIANWIWWTGTQKTRSISAISC